jgi:uncharacterized SAM-dependent methyltransferase
LDKEKAPNSLVSTLELLQLNYTYIDKLLEDFDDINLVDIGVGNGMPVKGLVEHLLKRGKLRRYIGIDISKELLDITQENFEKWFGDKVKFEGYVRDITYDRFEDLLLDESFESDTAKTANLILFLGGTISNFRDPNRAITTMHDSMGKQDIFMFSKKLDTQSSRRYFQMGARGNQAIDLVLRLLNIDESYYTLEQFFDEKKMARQIQAKLNMAISVEFELNGKKKIVELNKDESILLWRARHQNYVETLQQFDANDFELLEAMRSKDQEYLLLIAKIKRDRH